MESGPKSSLDGEIVLPDPERSRTDDKEQQPEIVPEKVLSPNTVALESMKMSADAAYAHAIESADEPIEGHREKRAEVKDKSDVQIKPESLGSILAEKALPKQQRSEPQSSPGQPPKEPPPLPINDQSQPPSQSVPSHDDTSDINKKSMLIGFAGALVILTIWIILQFVF